ncbi:PREDICTED: ribonuclease-like 3 [Poecilia mexicana]|uniref:ribonuclease-like 3 n=1 Tax=Poecilia mexicana TaxID=48701 RepID=UPI00072EB780|nr:PREDICTED: ribonuclease-like 3 [Poecilia mexicana]
MKTLPGRLFLCLLLLEFSLSKPLNETNIFEPGKVTFERYNKFKVQHIDKKMTVQKCTAVIKQKNIYGKDNGCKATNTFILADPNEVKSICEGEGDYLHKSHLTKSKRQFSVVVCTLTKGARKPRCEYEGKLHRNRFVLVQCSGVPVQYAENILDVAE